MGQLHDVTRQSLLGPQSLQWRHNGRDGVSNYQPHHCLLNRLFRRRSTKTSKLRVTGLCAGNSPVTGEFPTQRASNAENVSIWLYVIMTDNLSLATLSYMSTRRFQMSCSDLTYIGYQEISPSIGRQTDKSDRAAHCWRLKDIFWQCFGTLRWLRSVFRAVVWRISRAHFLSFPDQ